MNDTLPDLPNDPSGDGTRSPDRRRLLKAAASIAPLAATLPNGAALAATSIHRCISHDKALSDIPTGGSSHVPDESPTLDGFVRQQAYRVVWSRNAGMDVVVTYTFTAGAPPLAATYYLATGATFDPAAFNPVYTHQSTTQTYVLAVFEPVDISDPGGGISRCNDTNTNLFPDSSPIEPPVPGAPNQGCIYPVMTRQTGLGGNMGITNSCLASAPLIAPIP